MGNAVHAYTFCADSFAPAGDTIVCIVAALEAEPYLSKAEIEDAFSGCAVYELGSAQKYVGVWGRRNTKRLRRFLAERAATIIVHNDKPDGLRLAHYSTRGERVRVRQLV